MKIYSKVVIDIESMQVESADFFEYNGELAECKGTGGGSSGTVDYPAYMKTAHGNWLDSGGVDTMTYSVVDLMNTAMSGASPYSGYIGPDTEDAFFGAGKTIANYKEPFEYMLAFSGYDVDAKTLAYSSDADAIIVANVAANSAILDDEYDQKILPKFEHGMADINAVMSSAFVIGRGLLIDSKLKQIAKYSAELRTQAMDWALKRVSLNMEFHRLLTIGSTEMARIYLAARTEIDGEVLSNAEKNAKWDLEIYQYGTQVLASIGGTATSKTQMDKGSKIGGAISGALAGAAMGAMLGGPAAPFTATTGAVIGGIMGLAGGLL